MYLERKHSYQQPRQTTQNVEKATRCNPIVANYLLSSYLCVKVRNFFFMFRQTDRHNANVYRLVGDISRPKMKKYIIRS